MTTTQLRKKIDSYVSHFDEQKLEALLKMAQALDELSHDEEAELGAEDEKIIARRLQELQIGKVKGIPARKAIANLRTRNQSHSC